MGPPCISQNHLEKKSFACGDAHNAMRDTRIRGTDRVASKEIRIWPGKAKLNPNPERSHQRPLG